MTRLAGIFTAISLLAAGVEAPALETGDPPLGEYICEAPVNGKFLVTGWLTLHSDGTYTDHWERARGSWKYEAQRQLFTLRKPVPGGTVVTLAAYSARDDALVMTTSGRQQICYRTS